MTVVCHITAIFITLQHSQHRSCWFGYVTADVDRTPAGGISDEDWSDTAVVRSIRRIAHDQRWLRPGVTLNCRVCSRMSVQDCRRVRSARERHCSYCLTSFHGACYIRGNTCVSCYTVQTKASAHTCGTMNYTTVHIGALQVICY